MAVHGHNERLSFGVACLSRINCSSCIPPRGININMAMIFSHFKYLPLGRIRRSSVVCGSYTTIGPQQLLKMFYGPTVTHGNSPSKQPADAGLETPLTANPGTTRSMAYKVTGDVVQAVIGSVYVCDHP
ncbi:hypothetical protein BDR03DRAFT_900309 [Suillus americanus]|nr:hypothetical protein BDR03DRAFT_900309 [Suillus americanus]